MFIILLLILFRKKIAINIQNNLGFRGFHQKNDFIINNLRYSLIEEELEELKDAINKKDLKENYLIVCKNQTCSNKIKTIEELKSVEKNYVLQ